MFDCVVLVCLRSVWLQRQPLAFVGLGPLICVPLLMSCLPDWLFVDAGCFVGAGWPASDACGHNLGRAQGDGRRGQCIGSRMRHVC